MKVNRVLWRHEDTLYSYMTPESLNSLPSDPVSAAALYAEHALACDPIKNNLDRTRNPFYVKLHSSSYLSELRADLGFLTVVCEEGTEPIPGVRRIDIAASVLRRFTNTAIDSDDKSDVSFSRRLVDIAIAAGAAWIFLIRDEWFSKTDPALSDYRGVILIDSGVFLEYVDSHAFLMLDEGETEMGFPLPYNLAELNSLVISVDTQSTESAADRAMTGASIPCPDFALIEPACPFERGYHVFIKDQRDDEIILDVVYNVSSRAPLGSLIGAPLLGRRASYKRKLDDD